jgi:hypothetical protein
VDHKKHLLKNRPYKKFAEIIPNNKSCILPVRIIVSLKHGQSREYNEYPKLQT